MTISLLLSILLLILSYCVNGFHIKSSSSLTSSLSLKMMSSNGKLYSNFDALLFDCDGVIAETERDVHRYY